MALSAAMRIIVTLVPRFCFRGPSGLLVFTWFVQLQPLVVLFYRILSAYCHCSLQNRRLIL